MPLKKKPIFIPDGNILAIQPQNALGFNVNKTTKSILAESKLPSKF